MRGRVISATGIFTARRSGAKSRKACSLGAIDVGRPARLAFNRDDWQNARAMGFETVAAGEMHRGGLADLPARILERAGDRSVFLSFEVDFVDLAYAPGTGTPEVGGFATWQAQILLRGLAGSTSRRPTWWRCCRPTATARSPRTPRPTWHGRS